MRDFAKFTPQFWTGHTGRTIHDRCPEGTVVAAYLISSPHSNALGLYYLPKLYIPHETGLGSEGAIKGLQRAIEAGFCHYDDSSEMVFVPEMARMQIAEQLEPKDNRCRWVQKEYDALPENPFLACFYEKYAAAFHLENMRRKLIQTASPLKGASETLRSQETEIETDTEQEIEKSKIKAVAPNDSVPLALSPHEETDWSVIRRSTPTEDQVERLYHLYPLKVGKSDAKKAIRKAVVEVRHGDSDHPAMALAEALDYLEDRLKLYARCVQGRKREYIPYPATWFNKGKFWDDEKTWQIEGSSSKKPNGGFHHNGDDSRYTKGADLVYDNNSE